MISSCCAVSTTPFLHSVLPEYCFLPIRCGVLYSPLFVAHWRLSTFPEFPRSAHPAHTNQKFYGPSMPLLPLSQSCHRPSDNHNDPQSVKSQWGNKLEDMRRVVRERLPIQLSVVITMDELLDRISKRLNTTRETTRPSC